MKNKKKFQVYHFAQQPMSHIQSKTQQKPDLVGFLPNCPTMSLFLLSISPSFWKYERDFVCVEGIYTFDKLAALPFEKYLGIMPSEDAKKLFSAVQATKNGDLCPYGDNSGRMLPVGYTSAPKKLSHEWDWADLLAHSETD